MAADACGIFSQYFSGSAGADDVGAEDGSLFGADALDCAESDEDSSAEVELDGAAAAGGAIQTLAAATASAAKPRVHLLRYPVIVTSIVPHADKGAYWRPGDHPDSA